MPAIPVNAAAPVSAVPDASILTPELLAAMLMNTGDVDVDARKISLGNIGNAASLGFSGLGILNGLSNLFDRDISEEINEIVARQAAGDVDARRVSLGNIGNAASLAFSGLGILNGLSNLFGRDISDEIMAELAARDVASGDLDARRISLGAIANGATLGSLGLSLLGGLFGGGNERRDLADDLEARKFSLGNAATIAGLGLSANNIINQLTDIFSRDLSESDMEARRISLGAIANGATLGSLGLSLLGGLFGVGNDEARDLANDLEARKFSLGNAATIAGLGLSANNIINQLTDIFSRSEDPQAREILDELEARRISLGTAANIAGLGSAGLGIINGLTGLFSRELSESDMEARRISLGAIANGATLGSLGLSLLGGLFGGGSEEARELSDDAILAQLFGADSALASLD